jgi:hypothetical protein
MVRELMVEAIEARFDGTVPTQPKKGRASVCAIFLARVSHTSRSTARAASHRSAIRMTSQRFKLMSARHDAARHRAAHWQ